MSVHTNYTIYPIAIKNFINENYNFKNINFGNIKNNVLAILKKLNIDDTLECDWEISSLYFFDKVNITKNKNKPSDFDDYSNFKFTLSSKENISNEDFEKALKKFENDFLNTYQFPIQKERELYIKTQQIKKKKKEKLVYFISGVILITLIISIYIFKQK